MTDRDLTERLGRAATPDEAFAALYALSQTIAPVRLWTVMMVDMPAGVARRAFSSHPDTYPVSGTKPVPDDPWFARLRDERAPYAANSRAAIARVFPDHETIAALGCGSVLNLPITLGGGLAATVNLLDAEGAFPPERVGRIAAALALPALATVAVARGLEM